MYSGLTTALSSTPILDTSNNMGLSKNSEQQLSRFSLKCAIFINMPIIKLQCCSYFSLVHWYYYLPLLVHHITLVYPDQMMSLSPNYWCFYVLINCILNMQLIKIFDISFVLLWSSVNIGLVGLWCYTNKYCFNADSVSYCITRTGYRSFYRIFKLADCLGWVVVPGMRWEGLLTA